jgi:Cu/Zn superoxide dismutase|eukprot:COSAG02_NODE_3378_length_6839_cov_12.056973_1_plen_359_part_00
MLLQVQVQAQMLLLLLVALGGQGTEGRTVTAVFSEDSVAAATIRGTVTFTQDTAADPVTVAIDLRGLRFGGADGNEWHVHDFPVTGDDCSQESVSGHYNPPASCTEIAWEDRDACRAVDSNSLSSAITCESVYTASQTDAPETRACSYTPASTSAGELSDNIGLLDGDVEEDVEQVCDGSSCFIPRAYRDTATDSHLTLFGDHSIVGRSIVIHKNDESGNARFACATIGQLRVATASFDESSAAASSVRGTVTFSGVQGGPTVVDIDLTGLENGPNPWHIHESALSAGATTCTAAETGGHFNPPTAPGQGELSTAIGDLVSPATLRKGVTSTEPTVAFLATRNTVVFSSSRCAFPSLC